MLGRRILALLLASAFVSSSALGYEEPAFTTVAEIGGVEYRQYRPYLVAETVVQADGDRNKAANIGFRRLVKYISGENSVQAEIAMTAPVQQQATGAKSAASVKIAMTTPVRQTQDPAGWRVAFIVPSEFDEANVPQPTNPDVYIRAVPGEMMAVVRYAGRWTDSNISKHKSELIRKLSAAGIAPDSEVVTAFYNAPFSLPFLRRNEVMVPVSRVPDLERSSGEAS
jgi:hypothetical protein